MSSVISKFAMDPLKVMSAQSPPLSSTNLLRFVTEEETKSLSDLSASQRLDLGQAKPGSCTVDYSGSRGWEREFLLPIGPADKVDLKKLRSAVHAGIQALRAQKVGDASMGLPEVEGLTPEEVCLSC